MIKRYLLLLMAGFWLSAVAPAQDFGGGNGSATDPYQIWNRSQLEALNKYLDTTYAANHYRLMADIEMGNGIWTPIAGGESEHDCFHGKLHGGGHRLSNLLVDGGSSDDFDAPINLGLFGALGAGAYIDSLHIVGGELKGGNVYITNIGALVGACICWELTSPDSIVIAACSNSATINTNGRPYSIAGGLVGRFTISDYSLFGMMAVRNCSNNGTVMGDGFSLGGVIGAINNMGSSNKLLFYVSNVYNYAKVQSTSISSHATVGGVVGAFASATSTLTLSECYAAGEVMAMTSNTNAFTGGIVGLINYRNTLIVRNAVAAQELLTGYEGKTHRIVGFEESRGTTHIFSDNYAYDSMLVNNKPQLNGTATDSIGADISLAALRTEGGYGFDFVDIWNIRAAKSFPYLQYQSAPVAFDVEVKGYTAYLDIAPGTDSVVVYSGSNRTYLATLTNLRLLDTVALPASVRGGDTLYFQAYQRGLTPSYLVRAIVFDFVGEGTAADPYQIWNRTQLEALNKYRGTANLRNHYRLMANIDLGDRNWVPVCDGATEEDCFNGKLHGGNHQLANLRVDGGNTLGSIGLFGSLGVGAYIDSLHIVGGEIKGGADGVSAGAFAGGAFYFETPKAFSDSIVMVACSNSATINTIGRAYSNAGGLVGYVDIMASEDSVAIIAIRNSSNNGTVMGDEGRFGGLVGFGSSGVGGKANHLFYLSDVYNYAKVQSTSVASNAVVGGIIGNFRAINSTFILNRCYAAGEVLADARNVNAYAGGIVGRGDSGGTISNAVAAQNALVGHEQQTHRIVGASYHEPITYLNNYAYDSMLVNNKPEANGTAIDSIGADISLAALRTEGGYGFNFVDIWDIRAAKSFPYHQYQSAPVAFDVEVKGITAYLDLAPGTDSVAVYSGSNSTYLATLATSFGGVGSVLLPANINVDDTLYFVSYQTGLTPSYVVGPVIAAAGLNTAIKAIFINDVEVPFDTTAAVNYVVTCGEAVNSLNFIVLTQDPHAMVAEPGSNFAIDVSRPNLYTVPIGVISADSSQRRDYRFVVEKYFDFDAIVVQKWNNVLLVNSNPDNNDGYTFDGYEWFRNGEFLGTGPFYSAGNKVGDVLDLTAQYHVVVHTGDGRKLQTCRSAPTVPVAVVGELLIYPNPLPRGSVVSIKSATGDNPPFDATAEVYSGMGAFVKQQQLTAPLTEVMMDVATGIYIIQVGDQQAKIFVY